MAYADAVTAYSGGSWLPDPQDRSQQTPPGTTTWQQPGESAPGDPRSPGGLGGPSRGKPKGWLIWGGAVVLLAVTVAVTVAFSSQHNSGSTPTAQSGSGRSGQQSSGSGSTGSGSTGSNSTASQSQLCQSDAQLLSEQISYSDDGSGNLAQMQNSYRQAAQQASSDPQLANDLDAVVKDLQQLNRDTAAGPPQATSSFQSDWTQLGNDQYAVDMLCRG